MIPKKCIIDTTEEVFSKMISCLIKTLKTGVTIIESKGLQELLFEINTDKELIIIFDPHTFVLDLERFCKKIFMLNPEAVLIGVCRNTCTKYLGLRLYRCGVNCLISGVDASTDLLGILTNAFEGKYFYPPEIQSAIRKREHILMGDFCNSLTSRELEVLQQLADRVPFKLISKTLHIAESTVSTTLHRVMKKLGVESREQAVEILKFSASNGD